MARAKKIVLVSNNIGSRGLKALANRLTEKVGYRVLRVLPHRVRLRIPVSFHVGLDKISQLRSYERSGVSHPGFVLNSRDVDTLSSKQVVVRRLINASEGRGITIINKGDPVPHAPLYTEYIPKKKEFRVHVFDNQVIDVAEKRKRAGYSEERDTQIRNTANGYVFCRTGVVEPDTLRSLALRAVEALGRSQGAVDIIYNDKRKACYVLEVNSRPGMEGTTVEKYADAIVRKFVQ